MIDPSRERVTTGSLDNRTEFRGYYRGQDGSLEAPGVLSEPEITLSPTEPDVREGLETASDLKTRAAIAWR
jgi:hypothetical protein